MKSSMGIHFLTVVDHDLSAGLLHTSSSTAPLLYIHIAFVVSKSKIAT